MVGQLVITFAIHLKRQGGDIGRHTIHSTRDIKGFPKRVAKNVPSEELLKMKNGPSENWEMDQANEKRFGIA